MTKVKVEKILAISFIGFIITFILLSGGTTSLTAGQPTLVSKTEVNFEKRLQTLEDDLVSGSITKHEYDSLSDLLRLQIRRSEALKEEKPNPDRMPAWVTSLGIHEPQGMKFDPVFSHYTFFTDPTERFNSVSLVYTGEYEKAVEEAARIAANAKLTLSGDFRAIGSPARNEKAVKKNQVVRYLNYSLETNSQDFLISLQVDPSGRLTLMVTDNKQLNACLMAYEPLNIRENGDSKQKKQ